MVDFVFDFHEFAELFAIGELVRMIHALENALDVRACDDFARVLGEAREQVLEFLICLNLLLQRIEHDDPPLFEPLHCQLRAIFLLEFREINHLAVVELYHCRPALFCRMSYVTTLQ